jgi:hypothetical protein
MNQPEPARPFSKIYESMVAGAYAGTTKKMPALFILNMDKQGLRRGRKRAPGKN